MNQQKVDEIATNNCKETVLFNSDTLSKIISFLPSADVLNLALTCKQFCISDDDSLSVIKQSTHILVQDVATDYQLAALPHYDGDSTLADYHYLQLMRSPLTFDQLVGRIKYVNSSKSCVMYRNSSSYGTAFSNNILRAGKHYVSYTSTFNNYKEFFLGVMRPGQANLLPNQNAYDTPLLPKFFQNFSRHMVPGEDNNSIQCCLYDSFDGSCLSSDWVDGSIHTAGTWHGSEGMSSGDELEMLLDLDEGTLSVYKNGRKLGVMKRGLAGPYCWVVSMPSGGARSQVTIKRGTIPPEIY